MNKIEINFREPNVDRFCEMMLTAAQFGYRPHFGILNKPDGYTLVKDLEEKLNRMSNSMYQPYFTSDLQKAVFICEYPPNIICSRLFVHTCESVDDIAKRIKKVEQINKPEMDDAAFSLLKSYITKMNVKSRDLVQDLLDLSCIIAAMDGELVVRGHHFAEACQYCCKSLDLQEK